jgi:glycosyltransferase involved in cell wall biosynthesis
MAAGEDGRGLQRLTYRCRDWYRLPLAATEAWWRSFVEAMARQVPVLAAADGGIPEIVADGESGLLFPVGDVARIATLLGNLLREPSGVSSWAAGGDSAH